MPVLNGLEATRRIVGDEGRPPPDGAGSVTRVLVVTTFDLDDYVYQALRSGASGFILEDVSAGRWPRRSGWWRPGTRWCHPR